MHNTIKVINKLPELLEAVCLHPDCPNWLKDGIWNVVNAQNIEVSFSADYWRGQLNSVIRPENEDLVYGTLDAERLL